MNSLLRFEWLKIWKQRKLIWLFLIVLICTTALLYPNIKEKEGKIDRAIKQNEVYQNNVNTLRRDLETLQREGNLEEYQEPQFAALKEMGSALLYWRVAINDEEWDQVPLWKADFFQALTEFVENGGRFETLEGVEQDLANQKNNWLLEHSLPYEDEEYPTSPHLLMVESASLLLQLFGLTIIILMFGNIVTIEREQRTYLLLNTQPIKPWQQSISKLSILFIVLMIYTAFVLLAGWGIAAVLSGETLELAYPQVLLNGEDFLIVSTFTYLIRNICLFLCACLFIFNTILLLGKWTNNSFSSTMVLAFLLISGFVITRFSEGLQTPYNPFYFLHFSVLDTFSEKEWVYLVSALIWSTLLLGLSIIFKQKEVGFLGKTSLMKRPFPNRKTRSGTHQLVTILRFEWRKTQRKGLYHQSNVLLILLLFLGYYMVTSSTIEKEERYIQSLEEGVVLLDDLSMFEDSIVHLKELEETTDVDNSAQIEHTEKIISKYEQQQELTIKALEGYRKQDWSPLYEYQLYINRDFNGEIEPSTERTYAEIFGQFTLDVSIAEKYWMIERNIRPVFSGEYTYTIHNYLDGKEEYAGWTEENSKVDNSGLFTLYLYFENYIFLIPLFVLLFLFGGGFASEKGKKATIQLLLTQPLKNTHIFFGKAIHATITGLLTTLGIFGLIVILGTIFKRFGDWNYPILHYASKAQAAGDTYSGTRSGEYGFHFVPLGEHLLYQIGLLILVILFVLVVTITFSILFQKVYTVFMTAVLFFGSGYVLSIYFLAEHAHLSPFTYFNIPKIVNGELATILNNPLVNPQIGSVIIIIYVLLFLIFGFLKLKQRSSNDRSNQDSTKTKKELYL
nr:ABC transporter permease subunit [Bacillus sp. THAF10]